MEDLRKRISVTIANNEKDFLEHFRKPNFISLKTFDKSYAAIYKIKPILMLNKPIYVGFTVLELSKWLMHNFHYNFVKKHVDAELLFTDTDSLTYETKSEDVYEDFLKPKHLFDLSNYPKDSKFYYAFNEGVIVKMKDQHKGKPITKLI